jgi:hypothetical protein
MNREMYIVARSDGGGDHSLCENGNIDEANLPECRENV